MNLTPEQMLAITHPHSTAVIASAGTGKTTVLTQRFLHCLIQRGAKLSQILAFTFTDKAAREMRERVIQQGELALEEIPLLNLSTIHAFCRSILSEFGEALQLKDDFKILDATHRDLSLVVEVDRFIATALKNHDPTITNGVKSLGLKFIRKVMTDAIALPVVLLDDKKLVCLNEDHETDRTLLTDLLKSTKKFEESQLAQRIQTGLLCFDDLEILAVKLLRTNAPIRSTLQRRFKFILVDEFQDISPLEAELVRSLFDPKTNELFIVGDPKQSIYRFRGADVRLFDETAKLISNSGGLVCHLAETFRTPIVLKTFFDKVFPQLLPDTLKSPVITNHNVPDSRIYVHPVHSVHDAQPKKPTTTQSHQEYARMITEKILNLIAAGSLPSEIAILFYAGTPVSIYRQMIENKGLPVVVETASTLLDDPFIAWLWHVLNYLAGARDKVTQMGLLRSPVIGLSEALIERLALSKQDDFFKKQTLDLFDTEKDQVLWQKTCFLMDAWQSLIKDLTASELVTTIIADLKPQLTVEQELAIQHLCDLFESWQQQGLSSLAQIKDLLLKLDALDLKHTLKDEALDGIRLLSIHRAKGLEFDHVFLIPGNLRRSDGPHFVFDPEKGFFFKIIDPKSHKQLHREFSKTTIFETLEWDEKQKQNDELRRLLYVAMTRSKKTLSLFAERPAQETLKLLEKDSNNTTLLQSYNDWLYWITLV